MRKNHLTLYLSIFLLSLAILPMATQVKSEVNSVNPPEDYEGKALEAPPIVSEQIKDKLIIKDVDPWGTTSLEDALNYLGYSYDIVTSSGLPSVNLKNYKVVIIASDQPDSFYDNMVANKALIEEYVMNGGILIAHMCDMGWSMGFWEESFLPGAISLSHITDYVENLSVVDPTHPIINGPYGILTDENLDEWGHSSHGYFTNLPANARILIGVADDPIGKPVYIWWIHGRGAVFATMQTVEWGYGIKYQIILLLNEIVHAQTLTLPVGGVIISTGLVQTISTSCPWLIIVTTIIMLALIRKRKKHLTNS